MPVIKPPTDIVNKIDAKSVFLGGTIDMNNSIDWQTALSDKLLGIFPTLTILNPRRDNWDSSWSQDPESQPFSEQVKWELYAQERAGIRVYYFLSHSKSPITLLELGAFGDEKAIIYCPKDFYRYGNVAIFCQHRKIPYFTDVTEFEEKLLAQINKGFELI